MEQNEKKMTQREFFNAILASEVSEDLKDYAREAIEKLDKRNEKRTSKPSKTATANEPIKANILEALAEKPMTAPEIGEALEISTQKASSLCRQLVAEGKLTDEEVKVPKKGKIKQYTLA